MFSPLGAPVVSSNARHFMAFTFALLSIPIFHSETHNFQASASQRHVHFIPIVPWRFVKAFFVASIFFLSSYPCTSKYILPIKKRPLHYHVKQLRYRRALHHAKKSYCSCFEHPRRTLSLHNILPALHLPAFNKNIPLHISFSPFAIIIISNAKD